ncbi:Malate transporter, aliminium toerance [Metarhizium brunneum]
MAASNPFRSLVIAIWGDWQQNALWQRIVKYSLACTIATIIAILPHFKTTATFLIPMVVVFAHPGQRMGRMMEELLMTLFGALLGLSWSLLGLYLSSLVQDINAPAAYTIRALFLLVAVLIHGFVRSMSPRLFNFVLFLLVAALLTIQLPSNATTSLFTTIYIPILLGGGVLVVVNLALFPELSSSYLGSSTIETLSTTVDTLARATHWFITPGCDAPEAAKISSNALATTSTARTSRTMNRARRKTMRNIKAFAAEFPNPFHTGKSQATVATMPVHRTTMAFLTAQKSKLRSQLSRCKAAQDEVNFEISTSPLPPIAMKPISVRYMTSLVQNIITLVGNCENKFVLVGNEDHLGILPDYKESTESATPDFQTRTAQRTHPISPNRREASHHNEQVKIVKPVREIEAGSSQLLEMTIQRIRLPVQDFQSSIKEAVNLLIACLAYCFEVPKLPSGSPAPDGILLEEIDSRIDEFSACISAFDAGSAQALKKAIMDESGRAVDFMPRMETFLVSSFILALRDSATQILHMLRHVRTLVEKRQRRHNKFRVWVPQYRNIRKWLTSGGEADAMVLPKEAKKAARQGLQSPSSEEKAEPSSDEIKAPVPPNDEETCSAVAGSHKTQEKQDSLSKPTRRDRKQSPHGRVAQFRSTIADVLEWVQQSDDVEYALKLAIAIFLVTWPAFVSSSNAWYSEAKGVWAPMQLILVFEVAIGTSVFVFAVRLFGVIFGCVVGYLSVEIGRGNRVAAVVILLFGIVPSAYVQVATKYVKAGMISIVSLAVVALAAINETTAASEVFYKRLVAFLVGGLVAMVVETLVVPVRARDRLVESLSTSVRQVQKMQAAVAVGIDDPERPNFRSSKLLTRFSHSRDKAQGALAAAEMFLPFCLTEPRLKGSFKPLAPIYKEIIYVLHQIIDRMDNVVQLRRVYGSSILEDLNPKVYTYRRNVAASSTLILFSVHEALTTWLPLPQFLPSARLAQLRLISRIRELLIAQSPKGPKPNILAYHRRRPNLDEDTASLITQHKFLSWNASTSGQMEIIEYLEELVELVKLLVGVNAFRSGLLERPQYRQYIRQLETEQDEDLDRVLSKSSHASTRVDGEGGGLELETLRRRATATGSQGISQPLGLSQVEGEPGRGTDDSEDEDEAIPRSLQRVGARLMRDDTVVRRRRFTVSHSA